MKKMTDIRGFTLTELLVSIAITSVLMLGISTFFSSTFRNMFLAREEVTSTQSQFVVNTIMGEKFMNALRMPDSVADQYALLQNDPKTGDLPFTYIGMNGDDELVFKDFFIFNGWYQGLQSSSYTAIDNPAGIVQFNPMATLVASPMENLIRSCLNPTNCGNLILSGSYTKLNSPLGLAIDIPGGALYVADAGNGRIISVDLLSGNDTDLVIDGLNFPTGLAYYDDGSDDYLFVSEPYKNQVLKVKISDGTTKVVVGNGDNEDCDGTASFCKLNFPTGLVVGNGSLYIADTGNGRVLRMYEPPAPTDFEFPIHLSSSSQLSGLSFDFPAGTVINSITEGAGGNSLHKGKYSIDGTSVDLELYAQTKNPGGNYSVELCAGDPEVCTYYFRGYYVTDENNIFTNADNVKIDTTVYDLSSVTDEGGNTWLATFTSPTNITTFPSDGVDVFLNDSFNGDYSIFLNLNDVDMPDGFNKVTISALDISSPTKLPVSIDPDEFVVRAGNGKLGTEEDLIQVVSSGHLYVSGLGWNAGPNPTYSTTPDFSPSFPDYDYTSDFEVDKFSVDTYNGGEILEFTYDALISGTAGEDDEDWETYTFNSAITP